MGTVSIIIPNYNGTTYINQCIDSCLKQGDSVKEIIIIDDHSSDGSWEILLATASRFPELIRVVKNDGKGACRARNYGFELSSGDYIQWLDSDDFLGENKLVYQLQELKNAGSRSISFSQTVHQYNFKDGSVKEVIENYPCLASSTNPSEFLLNLWGGSDFKAGTIQTGAWLIPRDVTLKAGVWNENLLRDQDGEYFTRVVLSSRNIIYSVEVKAYYRKFEDGHSITQTNKEPYFRSELDALNLKYSYLNQQKDKELYKKAFANLYLQLAIKSYGKYDALYQEAWEQYVKQGYKAPVPKLGGRGMEILHKLLGWKAALRIKQFLSK